MKIRGLRTSRLMARWLRSRIGRGGMILLYHRVAVPGAPNDDPFDLCVSPENFSQQMVALRRLGVPTTLASLSDSLSSRSSRAPVAVTFDDGYVDNLLEAKPTLEANDIPATFFIVSGNLGRTFWWDQLTRVLTHGERLPGHLDLRGEGLDFHRSIPNSSIQVRRALIHALHARLLVLPARRRQHLLDVLGSWSGIEARSPEHLRSMSEDELRRLAESDLFEVGAHSVSHAPLPALAPEAQRREIGESRRSLEEITRRPVSSFSYPYGLISRLIPSTPALVREAGFDRACLADIGMTFRRSDPYRLPRFWISNWSGDEFTSRLRRWLPPRRS